MSDRRPGEQRGVPVVAVLLTWFLPGAGHLYLGRTVLALGAFLVVEGLFLGGLLLSHGRTFEFLDPELRGPFATLLTPEAGNLGGILWQLNHYGFGGREPSPWPPTMMLGTLLTALSGFANVCLMAHAHLEARLPRSGPAGSGPSPAFLVGLTWVAPGLGHLAQGRRARAAIVFLLLVGFFAWGTWLCGGANLSRERHFYYWSGQFLAGLPVLVTEWVSGRPPVTGEQPHGDVGLLFGCMAGLLNILAMLDVYGVGERRLLGDSDASEEPGETPEPTVPTGAPERAQPTDTEEAPA